MAEVIKKPQSAKSSILLIILLQKGYTALLNKGFLTERFTLAMIRHSLWLTLSWGLQLQHFKLVLITDMSFRTKVSAHYQLMIT